MRLTRLLLRTATVVAVVLGTGHQALAAGTGGAIGDDGRPRVWAATDGIVVTGGRPACVWNRLTNEEAANLDALGNREITDPDDPFWDEWFTTVIGGVTVYGYTVDCPGAIIGFRWVDLTVDPTVLIPPLLAAADEIIQPPGAAINPPVGTGGYVNLGLWLAVTPQEYPQLSAIAGPTAWITATPTLTSTTFDLGDGNGPVTCDGVGTPIVDLDEPGEGPCGHTYRQPGTYTITITSRWDFPYESSDGPGTFGPLLRTATFTYEVREIQTVGASG